MRIPHGPKPISRTGQIVLPKGVLKAADLQPGDEVYVMAQDDPPGTILVVPVELALRWFEEGRKVDKRDKQPDA